MPEMTPFERIASALERQCAQTDAMVERHHEIRRDNIERHDRDHAAYAERAARDLEESRRQLDLLIGRFDAVVTSMDGLNARLEAMEARERVRFE